MGRKAQHLLVALGLVVAAGLIAAGAPQGVDYPGPSWIGYDAGGPSIEALARGDLHTFFAEQPIMGSFSLVLRAPLVAIGRLASDDLLLEYRLGVFPCVLSLGILGLALAARTPRRTTQLLVVGLLMASPITFKAIDWGHPEELLAAALAVGGILAAPRRVVLAAVLLGLAIATKGWAILAVVPALVATQERRPQLLAITAAVAAALILPMAIGDLHRFADQLHASGHTGPGVTPSSVWWSFGHVAGSQPGIDGGSVPEYAVPMLIRKAAQPFVIALCLGLTLLFWLRRGSYRAEDGLALFALLLLLRCMLDPFGISYHHAPFFAGLVAYEMVRRRGVPVLGLAVAGAILVTAQLADRPDTLNAVYLSWAVPMAVLLASVLFAPGRWSAATQQAFDRPHRAS